MGRWSKLSARSHVVADDVIAGLARRVPRLRAMPQVMMIDQRKWRIVLGRRDLRRDLASLPHRGPLNITDRAMNRHRGFAAQEGGRTRWFRGGTPGQLDALDRIAQIKAETHKNDGA